MSELLQLTFWATFLSAAVRTAIPILCASIGEDISEKAGIINVGLEAVMLVGAFFWVCGSLFDAQPVLGVRRRYARRDAFEPASRIPISLPEAGPERRGRRTEPACYRAYQLYFPTDGQPVWDPAD